MKEGERPYTSPEADSTDSGSRESKSLLNRLIADMAADKDRAGIGLVAEDYFHRLGVIDRLKSTGILPEEDPNPFDIDSEPEKYAQWWNEHPDIDPWVIQEQYDEAIRSLYIGARLGFEAGKLMVRVPHKRIDDTESADDLQ